MKSKDATPLMMRELQLGSKRWIVPVPVNLSNVNEVTRRATREPDSIAYHYRRYPKLTLTTAFVWLLVMIGCAWGIYELFQ